MGFTFGSTHPTDGLARAPRRSSHRTAGLLGMTGLHGTTDFTQGRPPGAPAMAAIGRRPPRPASPPPNPPALRPPAAAPTFCPPCAPHPPHSTATNSRPASPTPPACPPCPPPTN